MYLSIHMVTRYHQHRAVAGINTDTGTVGSPQIFRPEQIIGHDFS